MKDPFAVDPAEIPKGVKWEWKNIPTARGLYEAIERGWRTPKRTKGPTAVNGLTLMEKDLEPLAPLSAETWGAIHGMGMSPEDIRKVRQVTGVLDGPPSQPMFNDPTSVRLKQQVQAAYDAHLGNVAQGVLGKT